MSIAIFLNFLIFVLIFLILMPLNGGFFLTKDTGKAKRTVYSLTIRVVLSVRLFLLLILGFVGGQLQPHGLRPQQSENIQS